MQTKNKLTVFLLMLPCLLLGACQNSGIPASAVTSATMPRIAVLPFDNLSSDPNAGLVVMSSLQTALAQKKANMVTPGEVREKLMPYEGSYLPPKKLGEILNADAVICGDVSEYRYVYGTGEQPSISYNVRIVNVKTGALMWSKAVSSSGNFSWIKEGSLGEAAKQSAKSISSEIMSAIKN